MTGEKTTQLRVSEKTFAERFAVARSRLFVGRSRELTAFHEFMGQDSPFALWFITGAGGVGKSTLLRRFRELAAGSHASSVSVDARQIPPNPPAVKHALARAAGAVSFEDFCLAVASPLLFIDTFECWQGLEPWLREDFLPVLPASLKIIVCSRVAPSLEWRSDEGWRALMQRSVLAPLEAPECDEYLQRRGVAQGPREQLISFSGGHPLALAMGADSLLSGNTLDAVTAGGDDAAIQGLVECFARDARDVEQRRALDACAVAREINESLLATMLDTEDVAGLMRWLRGLAFIQAGEFGIFPHDLVREVLMRQMPQRAPGRYEAMAGALFEWTVEHAAQAPSWAQATRLAADITYALRTLPIVQNFLDPVGVRSLYLDSVRASDEAALAEMVLQHQGAQSLHWFRFWYQRQPQAIKVVRDARESPRGFFMLLDMEALDATDRDTDPLTQRLWSALSDEFDIRPGEHAPFVRFWMSATHGQSSSPEKTLIIMAVNTYNVKTQKLRMSAQVFRDVPEWVAQAKALGIELLADSDTRIGVNTWRIYYYDWQRESPAHFYRRFPWLCIGFQTAVTGNTGNDAGAGPYRALSESACRDAVIEAVKHLHRPGALASNPLLSAALVTKIADADSDRQARIRVLCEQIQSAVEAVGQTSHRWQRILHRAYLAPAPNQKQAAAALNIGYSTFRRQLVDARNALADEVWQREKAAR